MKIIKLKHNYETMVSDEDYEELSKYKWHVEKRKNTNYVKRSRYAELGRQAVIGMHEQIMGTPDGMYTDHIDGNGLNNTRENLRIVTPRQNTQNRHSVRKKTQYVGVSWHNSKGNWRARIMINGYQKHLGNYKTEIEAYTAYLNALKELNEVCVHELAICK